MFKIKRIEYNKNETLGVLIYNNLLICYTLELPWLSNKKNISCIPQGIYPIKKIESPKFGTSWLIDEVPNRSEVIIHVGNTYKDTKGCVIIGNSIGYIKNERAVLSSRAAIGELMNLTKDFTLSTIEVTNV
jgi:hypothetical protein